MHHVLNKQSKTNRDYNITQTKSPICICGLIVLEFTIWDRRILENSTE